MTTVGSFLEWVGKNKVCLTTPITDESGTTLYPQLRNGLVMLTDKEPKAPTNPPRLNRATAKALASQLSNGTVYFGNRFTKGFVVHNDHNNTLYMCDHDHSITPIWSHGEWLPGITHLSISGIIHLVA